MTARELGEHIKKATEALGLKYQEQYLVNFRVEIIPFPHIEGALANTYLIFSYENLEYRVRV